MTCNNCSLMRFNRQKRPMRGRRAVITDTECACKNYYMRTASSLKETPETTDVIFIGDAPSRADDALGRPFSGNSGALLNKMIVDAMYLAKATQFTYFATYLLGCRPCDSLQGDNRPATKEEFESCTDRFLKEYATVSAPYTIFLGEVAGRIGKKLIKTGERWLHPAYILKKGGATSAVYLQFVRNLSKVMIDAAAH